MKTRLFYILSLAASFVFAAPTYAVGNLGDAAGNLGAAGRQAGTNEGDISTIAGTGINIALSLVGIIFMVLMVYAGYLWMTARGESEQVEKARRIIIAAVIGLVIVMSAYAITALITGRFSS